MDAMKASASIFLRAYRLPSAFKALRRTMTSLGVAATENSTYKWSDIVSFSVATLHPLIILSAEGFAHVRSTIEPPAS